MEGKKRGGKVKSKKRKKKSFLFNPLFTLSLSPASSPYRPYATSLGTPN